MKKSIFLFFAAILCAMSVSAKTVYLKAGQWTDGGAKFGCHTWGSSDKSGFMTHVEGDIYSFETLDANTDVIFTRVASGATGIWNQEWDRVQTKFVSDKNMFVITDWKAGKWDVYAPAVTHTFAKNSTLYIDFRAITDASKKGANYPKAGTASGLDYSANAGGTVIPVTFTADVKWAEGAEFMKTEKGEWASIPFKAPEAGQNCAQVAADGKSYTWTTFSEPSVTLSLDKTEADAGTEVTVTLTATADNVSGEVTYAFQYSTDNATWNNITATDNTATQTFAAETRYYKVTMTNGGTTKEATAKFSAIKFHIIGSWDSWTAHNEVVEGSKTITLEATKTYEYKITNGTWDLSWGNDGTMTREDCTNWSFEASGNAKITTDEAGDYVFNVSRNAEGKVVVSVTYPELVTPIPTYDYYIAGNMNDWNPKHPTYGMTDEDADGIYEKEITLAAGQDHQFKVTNGKWGNEENGFDCATVEGAYEEVDSKDGNVLVKLNAETTFIVKFDKNAEKITFEGLTPYVAPLTYTVTVPAGTEKCYIAGKMNGWAFQEMEAVTGETNKFTITIVGAKETDEYKYACQADWAYAEVIDGGGNRTNWSELDEVTAWGKPVVYTYYLVGVNGDWATGIEMEVNTGAENEVMLTCQPVNGEVKIKRIGDDESVSWYGGNSLKTADGSLGTNTSTDGGDGNILLEEGIYNFYFNTADGKLWIAAATDCEPTPDYTRTVTSGQWGTICLPNASSSFTGATFYEVSSLVSGEGLWLNQLANGAQLVAGKPYIFQATATKIEVTYTGEAVGAPIEGANGLTGTFTGIAAGGLTGNYIIAENKVWVANDKNTLPANRAYISSTVPTTAQAEIPGRRRVLMGENAATGVDNIIAPEGQAVKAIVNGQLIIIRDGVKYNVQGQKL